MGTASCSRCRSVNNDGVPRCMNCGAPMEVAVVSPGPGSSDLPAAPTPAEDYGWGALVPKPPVVRRRSSGLVSFLGLVALVAFVGAIAIFSASPQPVSESEVVGSTLFALLTVSGFFWIWMLVDAVSNSKVGWAIAIFLFGVVAALLYALLARPRQTVHS
jgi:hypothetical protein